MTHNMGLLDPNQLKLGHFPYKSKDGRQNSGAYLIERLLKEEIHYVHFCATMFRHLSGFSYAVFNSTISTSLERTKVEKDQNSKWVMHWPPLRPEMRGCDLLLQRTIFSQTGQAYKLRAWEPISWMLLTCVRCFSTNLPPVCAVGSVCNNRTHQIPFQYFACSLQ